VISKEDQIRLAEELQGLLLQDFRARLLDGTITPTDRASLARLLSQNGWTLDPSQFARGLESKMLKLVDPSSLDDDDVADARRTA
jgi:hypothetical protein